MGVLVDVALAHVGGVLAPELPAQQPGARPPTPKTKAAQKPAAKAAPAPQAGRRGRSPRRRTRPRPRRRTRPSPKAGEDEPEGVTPTTDTKKVEPPESFLDPRAKDALANTFPQVGTRTNAQVISQVKAMARGESQPDPATIRSFVDGMMYELTSQANIKALLESSDKPVGAAARGLEVATNNLLEPLTSARNNNNTAFLNAYNQVLLSRLPQLLDKHLLTRIEAMIVLGNTRSPNAIDLFIKQLSNPNQTVWVKLWAARGLANVTQDGQTDLDAQRGMTAGKAVADFLEQEKDLPWPVQVRALEALGALRQSSAAPLQGKADMASAALERLADPKARPEVRAWAAWALGLMRVNPQLAKYNYSLIAHYIGLLAADLGDKIAGSGLGESRAGPVLDRTAPLPGLSRPDRATRRARLRPAQRPQRRRPCSLHQAGQRQGAGGLRRRGQPDAGGGGPDPETAEGTEQPGGHAQGVPGQVGAGRSPAPPRRPRVPRRE